MMRKSTSYKYFFILFLFGTEIAFPQIKDSIKAQNQQLVQIKDDLTKLQQELNSKSKKERESLQVLETINKQNLLIGKLVNNLLSEEKQKEDAIASTINTIQSVEEQIKRLKEQYSHYVVWFYKNNGLSMWRFVFNSESFNSALVRYQYLKYITRQNKTTLARLNENKSRLALLQLSYEGERKEKEKLADQKLKEQEELARKENEKKELIKLLKKDQKIIAQEISLKRRAEIVIKNMIAKLIEVERETRKKTLEHKISPSKKLPQSFDYASFQNFAQLKGNLGWPVREGKIVRKFGENKNERLNTITLNYGIDISVHAGQNVACVAEGVVSAIDWIPGYGSIIIITHRDEYRTVYGHVSAISVKEGDRIKAGVSIGKVNESLEGNIVHFEIWNERNYQNPEIWLALR
jgi:murein hydrolase activator